MRRIITNSPRDSWQEGTPPVLTLSLTGCGDSKIDSKITKSNYDLIEIGMKEAAVEAILGKGAIPTNTAWPAPGQPGVNLPPGVPKAKTWKEGTKTISITFSDGKVYAFSFILLGVTGIPSQA